MEDQEYICDLCNVPYATEQELQDHNWSLMHHIKIEKVKKGAPHSCDLCMTSCSNIIEYGKHLNEDRHQLALSRRKKDGPDEPLDSFANMPDTTADLNPQSDMGYHQNKKHHPPSNVSFRSDRHTRSFSQPDLRPQQGVYPDHDDGPPQAMHQERGMNHGRQQTYIHGQWPSWDDLNPGFTQSLGNINNHISGGPRSMNYKQQHNQFYRDDFTEMNWNDDSSFYSSVPLIKQDNFRNRQNEYRARKGSLDSSFREPDIPYKHSNEMHWKKGRDKSWERGQDYSQRPYAYRQDRQYNDREFRRPESRPYVFERPYQIERGRGRNRDRRGRTSPYDQSMHDKSSPESNSSSDSGGLKRRLTEEPVHTTGKSRRGNESNRISLNTDQPTSLLDDLSNQRPRSRSSSYDRLPRKDMETDKLSMSTGRKVTWSDQQLVSSTTDEMRIPARTRSLDRLNESKQQVKPDSSSERKKLGSKKNKNKNSGKKKFPGKGGSSGRVRSPRSEFRNTAKESSATDSVLEKAEKLCKKLRNEREKAKQQRIISEKQKKMNKTEELNLQIEELSRRNQENIKGHLEIVENTLISNSVSDLRTENTSKVNEPKDNIHEHPIKQAKTPAKETTQKSNTQSQPKSDITERIAQTRADIDTIRAKIENSVHSEKNVASHSEQSKPAERVEPTPTKSARIPTPSELLSPGAAYSPGTSAQKPDHNALLKMVKSPRSTKERLWLAEMLRSHANSQTKLLFPRFNLKFSDLCTGSDRPNDLTDFDIGNLAPSIQLEIANIIEADTKPNVAELEKLLDKASAGNAELDSNILAELGIFQTTERTVTNERSPSPIRTSSPIVYSSQRYVDNRPSLSIEDLSTVEEPKLPEFMQAEQNLNEVPLQEPTLDTPHPRSPFSSSVPLSANKNRGETLTFTPSVLPKSNETQYVAGIKIKEERIDDGYNIHETIGTMSLPHSASSVNQHDTFSRESCSPAPQSKSLSPVRKSVHTQNLYSNVTELPQRDLTQHRSKSPDNDGRSALEKVTAILDGAPTMDKVLSGSKKPTSVTEIGAGKGPDKGTDTHFDSSQSSQTSSVLDQVYNISIQEEHVRHEINTTDLKIKKLQNLIEEASEQLNKFTSKKKELMDEEGRFRSSRMKLLQESRSQQGSSSSQHEGGTPLLGNLTDAQLQNLNNPVFIKFLMSQRQSDLSSIGGFSNVETGSQSEAEPNQQRRASLTSTSSEPQTLQPISEPVSTSNPSDKLGSGTLFAQSIDALSGSTETISSTHSRSKVIRDSGMPVPDSSVSARVDSSETSRLASVKDTSVLGKDSGNSRNSISMLNTPLEKVGFITLDALLKGDSDIGKLLHKSLESFNKEANTGQEKTPLKTQGSGESQGGSVPGLSRDRERRDSAFSVGSDDMLMSGSDAEKRSGKVSMKYMGTLPDGVSYDTLARQMSGGNSNKTVMFTVLNSPDAMTQLKKASDSELSPQLFPYVKSSERNDLSNVESRSDVSSNTMTADITECDTHSVKSTYSLGEQIKRMCEGQNPDADHSMQLFTPRSEDSSGDKTLEDEGSKEKNNSIINLDKTPVKDCYVRLENIDVESHIQEIKSRPEIQRVIHQDAGSPVRKRLKSKKERDQMSRRKQKESYLILSDTNSEADFENASRSSSRSRSQSRTSVTKSEDDMVQTGSEECKTPRVLEKSDVKKSLLDEVQLETETPSDSCEDRSQKLDGTSYTADERLRVSPSRLATFRANVKAGLGTEKSLPVVEYQGPSLSVAAIQYFQDDLYVCYNGSEIRRFDIKTGKILKELDCSPYLVNLLHLTSVEERQDILYTAGPCKKLMLFKPTNFNLIEMFEYNEVITCLHEKWGRLFIGLHDGRVSVKSLKTDKELNVFSCTSSSVSCIASTSAGMTKMLCLGTCDKMIYVVDAITGLLITMLEGHTLPPLCVKVFGETVLSGSADQTLLVHNVCTGELIKSVRSTKPVTSLWTDSSYIYVTCCDNLVRCYGSEFKLEKVCYGAGKGIVTYGLVHAGMLITGNREGMVEGLPLSQLNGSFRCQFDGCSLELMCYDHMKFHVLSSHNSSRSSQCTYKNCQFSFPNPESKQEHLLSHIQ